MEDWYKEEENINLGPLSPVNPLSYVEDGSEGRKRDDLKDIPCFLSKKVYKIYVQA